MASPTYLPIPSHLDTCGSSPKSEKHVSFDPELQYHEIRDIRSKHRSQVVRRVHVFGLLSFFLAFLIYVHTWPLPTYHNHDVHMFSQSPQSRHQQAMSGGTANHHSAKIAFGSLESFSLNEILDNQGYLLLDIGGTITLTSNASQDAAVVADVSMTSHNIDIASTNFDTTPNGLTIGNPELKNRAYLRRPVITIDVTVSVKPDTKLSTFTIATRHLNIEIKSDLDLAVSDRTTLSAVSGKVKSPTCPAQYTSREKHISTVSGGIHGSYALEDVLSVTSSSGGIRISVLPKKAGEEVRPAVFTAKSGSGHCDVQFDTVDVPEREYRIEMDGASGGMTGTLIHGSRTSVRSGSGSKRVTIVPYDGEGASELVTEGASGGSEITVASPLKSSKTLGAMRSSHRSVSGSLKLNYPKEWAGSFEGTSVSGHLSAEGPGLDIERGGGPGLKRVTGRSKLDGLAEMTFSSVSGGARLVVL